MFYLKHDLGAYFRYSENHHHKILHWWTGPKPWDALPTNGSTIDDVSSYLMSRAYAYLQRSELRGGGEPTADPTVRKLWQLRRAIEEDPRWLYVAMEPGSVSTYPLW